MIDKTLGNLLFHLTKQALKDRKITEDEERIISATTWNLAQLVNVIEKAEEDGVIDDQEREKIDFFIAQVQRDPEIMAQRDGIITADELVLLEIIKKMISKFDY